MIDESYFACFDFQRKKLLKGKFNRYIYPFFGSWYKLNGLDYAKQIGKCSSPYRLKV